MVGLTAEIKNQVSSCPVLEGHVVAVMLEPDEISRVAPSCSLPRNAAHKQPIASASGGFLNCCVDGVVAMPRRRDALHDHQRVHAAS